MGNNTFSVYTFGCRLNQAETQEIVNALVKAGWEYKPQGAASLFIVNTCTVTHIADRKVKQLLRRIRTQYPQSILVVLGCFVERLNGKAPSLIEGDLFLNNREKYKIVDILSPYLIKGESKGEKAYAYFRSRPNIKIQEGCNNFCSYCIVPYLRGPARSVTPFNVIEKVKLLELYGYKEVVLSGIDLGSYGKDLNPATNLAELLESLLNATSNIRIRLSSIEPHNLTSSLIGIVANSRRLCKHLHIPLQHSSPSILVAMKRRYFIEDYLKLVYSLREAVPEIALTTDVIVGFPGEKDDDFYHLCSTIREIQFAKIHIFPFSPRPGTEAEKLKDRVKDKVKRERVQKLHLLEKELRHQYWQQFLGKEMPVVVVESRRSGFYKGITSNYIPVVFSGEGKSVGGEELVKLTEIKDKEVMGECSGRGRKNFFPKRILLNLYGI